MFRDTPIPKQKEPIYESSPCQPNMQIETFFDVLTKGFVKLVKCKGGCLKIHFYPSVLYYYRFIKLV